MKQVKRRRVNGPEKERAEQVKKRKRVKTGLKKSETGQKRITADHKKRKKRKEWIQPATRRGRRGAVT